MASLPIKTYTLSPPPLTELATLLNTSLSTCFKSISASVVQCPDLRESPFNLAAAGLSGHERIADIGGPPYLHPLPDFSKKYSLLSIMKMMELPVERGFIIGAGAGPFHAVGCNSELMPNLSYEGEHVVNLSKIAKVGKEGECLCEGVPGGSTDFALMANLFGCEGLAGPVLKITAAGRIGEANFTGAIQEILRKEYGNRVVSLGGVFLIKRGKAMLHVMPDFSPAPLELEKMRDWLRFYKMSSPLVCLSTFHSMEIEGAGLRMEHTHCFGEEGSGQGGHYHNDTTPEEVVYEAYFNTAKVICRIDQPPVEG